MNDKPTKAVTIRGPLTDLDITEIVAVIRRADARNPGSVFEVYTIDPDSTLLDAKRKVAEMLGPGATIVAAAYHDDRYPPRFCNACGTPYQGPTIHCSFECATVDD